MWRPAENGQPRIDGALTVSDGVLTVSGDTIDEGSDDVRNGALYRAPDSVTTSITSDAARPTVSTMEAATALLRQEFDAEVIE